MIVKEDMVLKINMIKSRTIVQIIKCANKQFPIKNLQ
jgi:hypothetical protein